MFHFCFPPLYVYIFLTFILNETLMLQKRGWIKGLSQSNLNILHLIFMLSLVDPIHLF